MEFRLETCKNHWTTDRINNELPGPATKRMKNVNIYRHVFPFGKVSYQVLRLDTLSVWWYELVIRTPCTLAVYPYTSQFSLHFHLKNQLTVPFEIEPVLLREENTYLLYIRNVIHELSLQPGRYGFCQVDYNKLTLQKVAESFPELDKAIQTAEQGLGCNVFAEVPVTVESSSLLKSIFTEGSPWKRKEAQQMAMQLLINFLEKALIV